MFAKFHLSRKDLLLAFVLFCAGLAASWIYYHQHRIQNIEFISSKPKAGPNPIRLCDNTWYMTTVRCIQKT